MLLQIKPPVTVLPEIVPSSQVYGEVKHGLFKDAEISGLICDQQGVFIRTNASTRKKPSGSTTPANLSAHLSIVAVADSAIKR